MAFVTKGLQSAFTMLSLAMRARARICTYQLQLQGARYDRIYNQVALR